MLGEPTPSDADPTGAWYAFEKGRETRRPRRLRRCLEARAVTRVPLFIEVDRGQHGSLDAGGHDEASTSLVRI
jgi:hypothetical protein